MSGKATFSILGADVAVKGDIRAVADQGAESRIKGSLMAQSARLSGNIEGAISVGELVIESSARITGDVTYESITVAPGSQVDGRFTHRRGAGAAAGNAAPTELKLVSGEDSATA